VICPRCAGNCELTSCIWIVLSKTLHVNSRLVPVDVESSRDRFCAESSLCLAAQPLQSPFIILQIWLQVPETLFVVSLTTSVRVFHCKSSLGTHLNPLFLLLAEHDCFDHPGLNRYLSESFEPEPHISLEIALGLDPLDHEG
jgi:hypothetical protein